MQNYLRAISESLWNNIKFTITNLPDRFYKLLKHLCIVPFQKVKRNLYYFENIPFIKKAGILIIWWVITLVLKTLTITGIWELLDWLSQVVKPEHRKLTPIELWEARSVFGNSIDYSLIRIDENSLLARIGAKFSKKKYLGLVTFHSVNFTRKLNCQAGNHDMKWLIHELVHVKQMESIGAQYIPEALFAQFTNGYTYGDWQSLNINKGLPYYNLEQQADIISDYYSKHINHGKPNKKFWIFIDNLKQGKV